MTTISPQISYISVSPADTLVTTYNGSYAGCSQTVTGTASFTDITLNNESLNDRITRIEQVLDIPTRDIELEAKYPRLKEIFNEYVKALEQYKTWERIKNEK